MSGPAVQLTFTLRTSPNVRTVHLLGSWDGYKSQLPLAALKDATAKPGSWKGTFRFQGSHSLKLGTRYWYYYIVDGYHVSHDPAKEFTTEKTTGRKLNILDVPSGKTESKTSAARAAPAADVKTTSRHSREIPKGRALSPTRIQHPKPSKPYASRQLREADYETSPVDDLEERFANARLSSRNYSSSPSELSDSSDSSGTVFSKSGSDSSSASSLSDDGCRCGRFGVTKAGRRVMLDCGGKKCGYNDSSSDCSSSEEESDSEDEREKIMMARRQAQKAAAAKSTKSSAEPRRREVVVERGRR